MSIEMWNVQILHWIGVKDDCWKGGFKREINITGGCMKRCLTKFICISCSFEWMWKYCWLVYCLFLTRVRGRRVLQPVVQTGGSQGQSGVNHLQILLPGKTQNGLQVIDRYWGWAGRFFFLSWTHKQKLVLNFSNISGLLFGIHPSWGSYDNMQ